MMPLPLGQQSLQCSNTDGAAEVAHHVLGEIAAAGRPDRGNLEASCDLETPSAKSPLAMFSVSWFTKQIELA